ncbi:hypothetical protein Pse7367_2028 [Thalassoporum mexicanum PCC 7367]|uniref:DUF3288 family protein n=1 Tax=Thalassoporum mexicanum TaxID=3457544 RepID=UPI00029FC1D7|nr:DUF3288 family protein [Pseudanabaena sp. PCC 7367]AFY70299.1 hypothetical protein Pse7367_2028 [Pseudanabaena sp. PCC 7367]
MAKQEVKDQEHPQYYNDRQLLNELLAGEPTDRNLADLARLKIRYNGFPGARDIQTDLDRALSKWQLDQAQLFAKTRQIHANKPVYASQNTGRDDWA